MEDINLEKCKSKIRKHPELVNYIKNEVSSEFFDFIIDFSEIKIGNKIGSGKKQLKLKTIYLFYSFQETVVKFTKVLARIKLLQLKL